MNPRTCSGIRGFDEEMEAPDHMVGVILGCVLSDRRVGVRFDSCGRLIGGLA